MLLVQCTILVSEVSALHKLSFKKTHIYSAGYTKKAQNSEKEFVTRKGAQSVTTIGFCFLNIISSSLDSDFRSVKIMDFKSFSLILVAMLALSTTIPEANSAENGVPASSANLEVEFNEEEPSERSLPLRHWRSGDQTGRRRRGFARWNIPQEDYERFSVWQPSLHSLSKPYFIPVYGPSGQIPIFFPPQPYNRNVGIPPDNPMFVGPPYLPPDRTTAKPSTTTMKLVNRIPDFDDEDEARPVWGNGITQKPVIPTRRPRPRPQQNGKGSTAIPTRPPRPMVTTKEPPLVHHINGGKNPLNVVDESSETALAIDNIFGRPSNKIPSPQQSIRPSTRPVPLRTTTSPPRTTTISTPKEGILGPSNCVWAVVSCCSAASTTVSEGCFEQRGCPGPFWDRSPCESDFAKAAIQKALEYYGQ